MDNEEPETDIGGDVRLCGAALAGQIGFYEAAKAMLGNHSPEDPWCRDIPEAEILLGMVAEPVAAVDGVPASQHMTYERRSPNHNESPTRIPRLWLR